MLKHLIYTMILLFVLSGCSATPDLTAFANSSAALKGSVADVQADLLSTTDLSLLALNTGLKEESWENVEQSRLNDWKQNRQILADNIATLNAVLEAMVLYSEALSQLADSGEKGEEAFNSASSSLTSILSTVGGAQVEIVSEAVGGSLGKIAAVVTRVQAQEGLAKSMITMKEPINEVQSTIAKSIEAQQDLLRPIAQLRLDAIEGKYGPHRLAYYSRTSSYQNMEALFMRANADENKVDLLTNTLLSLEKTTNEYRAYLEERDAVIVWVKDTRNTLDAINKASTIWVKKHHEAAELLDSCGGMRSLRKDCGNLTLANLTSAIEQIQDIALGFGSPKPTENSN